MKQKLLVLGDSFCHGIGTASVFKHPDNPKFAFGKYIAEHFDLAYVNLAEPGISILKTIEIGYNYLKSGPDDIEKILIGWTNPSRIGLYSEKSMLQILPSYICLGDTADPDVFVDYKKNVKFITNKQNQRHLQILPSIHEIIIENDFFDQINMYQMCIELFKTWLQSQNYEYMDFSVFGNVPGVKLSTTFSDIIKTSRHPTKQEQEQFANKLLQEMQ